MVDYSNQGVVWYAMKTTYKRELQAKAYLDSCGVENFIPMQQSVDTRHGQKRVVVKPAVHNLIFVKADLAQLIDIKGRLSYLHNILTTEKGISVPIVVPTQQMDQFRDVTIKHLADIVYVDLSKIYLEKGTPVRITDGKFKGHIGELAKIKGKRDRVVHVVIQGVAAYRFQVEADNIEKI